MITEESMALLKSHDWPGNIRELRNVIKHAAVMADEQITPGDLRGVFGRKDLPSPGRRAPGGPPAQNG